MKFANNFRNFSLSCRKPVFKNYLKFTNSVSYAEDLKDNLLQQVEECHDRYIVLGDDYKQLRETLVTTLLSGHIETLEKILLVYILLRSM